MSAATLLKVTRASAAERHAYLVLEDPIYPAYGFVTISGQRCVVEDLRRHWGSAQFEIMAPIGWHFDEGPHSLLCYDLLDVSTRGAGVSLERCASDCDCMA